MTGTQHKIELIPWDCESDEHVERMYQQRIACGWRSDEVHKQWVDLTRAGEKMLYWAESNPIRDTASTRHLRPGNTQPKSHPPLTSTPSTTTPVRDSARPFVPVGHVALDLRPAEDTRLGLRKAAHTDPAADLVDDTVVWVANLYVSHALQDCGFGRDTMRCAEEIASLEPLRATCVVLDTMPREQQMTSPLVKKMFVMNGTSAPTRATQDWYARQGYQPFATESMGYTFVDPETGEGEELYYLFMKKHLP